MCNVQAQLFSSSHTITSMKLAISVILTGSAAAFAPSSQAVRTSALQSTLNGWTPDENKFAWGLPGSLDPAPEFDPFGFSKGAGELCNIMWYHCIVTSPSYCAMLTNKFLFSVCLQICKR